MDNLKIRRPQDDTKVNVYEKRKLEHSAKRFGISKLKQAANGVRGSVIKLKELSRNKVNYPKKAIFSRYLTPTVPNLLDQNFTADTPVQSLVSIAHLNWKRDGRLCLNFIGAESSTVSL